MQLMICAAEAESIKASYLRNAAITVLCLTRAVELDRTSEKHRNDVNQPVDVYLVLEADREAFHLGGDFSALLRWKTFHALLELGAEEVKMVSKGPRVS